MYKANKKHLQPPLLSAVQDLPEKYRQRLDQSWAGEFYREFFCRINESAFSGLYVDHPSRPNIPVNVLVGLDALKSGFGWSDEELYDNFLFDMQVRYALGYHNFQEGEFEIRTLYNFRRRLSEYNLAHGINLLKQVFENITDQQLLTFRVKTDQQRMDSTQIASNILDSSRLQLAAELLQRIHGNMLCQEDQERYAPLLAPYLKDTVNQFVYRIKGKDQVQEHLLKIGPILYQLIHELKPAYAQHAFFAVVERFFGENFRADTHPVQPKDGKELSSGCLQSLDDLEASYRQKGNRFFKGYVANVAETCHPQNELQLITTVQVAPNNVDDATLMIEALPNLADRMELKQLFTDGGYASPAADLLLRQQQVEQIPSAIRGTALNPDKLHLSAYDIQQDAQGEPTQITCPGGQTVAVQPTPSHRSFVARYDPAACNPCPFHLQDQCRILWRKKVAKFQMDFTQEEVDAAARRRKCRQYKLAAKNLRAAVEATMRSVKHPFPAGKLPVRGLFRVHCMVIGSAVMTNIRRICQYKAKIDQQKKEDGHSDLSAHPFWASVPVFWSALLDGFRPQAVLLYC